ncbi:MAG: S41 family peptidase [Cyclobacteriaceae bacterium]|nr:S41 family peptidase [Cyclobacteriaceae bacterium]
MFTSLFKEVNAQYVDEVKPEKLIKNGIQGMLETLDPYTDFIPEEEAESFRISTTGQYAGVGALVGDVKGKLVITHPYEGFPAYNAGLKVGDEIIAINDVILKGKNTFEVSNLLKGQPKTKVKIVVKRFGQKEPLTFDVTRAKISIKNVSVTEKLNNDIGYIKLDEFTPGASKEFTAAFNQLKVQGIKSLVIDLRDNPGGLLREAVNIVNLFLPKNTLIVETKGKTEESNTKFHTLNNPADLAIPIVVLVNDGSASASEIVAGSLQDYDRAVLIGQQTFGKGLVQITKPLAYNTQLKITTARYYIPSGRCIQALNYAQRKEDGSASKMSDTIRAEFKTKAGRIVYADDGLAPDIFIEQKSFPSVINVLIEEGLFFDFATQFVNSKTINQIDINEIEIGQPEFQSFIKFVKEENFSYSSPLNKQVQQLAQAIEKEKSAIELKKQLENIQSIIQQDKVQDLNNHQLTIRRILKQQIAFHLQLTKGLVISALPDDEAFIQAQSILTDNTTFEKLLNR